LVAAGSTNGHRWQEAVADYTDDTYDSGPRRYDHLSGTAGKTNTSCTGDVIHLGEP